MTFHIKSCYVYMLNTKDCLVWAMNKSSLQEFLNIINETVAKYNIKYE